MQGHEAIVRHQRDKWTVGGQCEADGDNFGQVEVGPPEWTAIVQVAQHKHGNCLVLAPHDNARVFSQMQQQNAYVH